MNKGFSNAYKFGSIIQWSSIPLASITISAAGTNYSLRRYFETYWNISIISGFAGYESGSLGMVLSLKKMAVISGRTELNSCYRSAEIGYIGSSILSVASIALWTTGAQFSKKNNGKMENAMMLFGYGSFLASQIFSIPIAIKSKKARRFIDETKLQKILKTE